MGNLCVKLVDPSKLFYGYESGTGTYKTKLTRPRSGTVVIKLFESTKITHRSKLWVTKCNVVP